MKKSTSRVIFTNRPVPSDGKPGKVVSLAFIRA